MPGLLLNPDDDTVKVRIHINRPELETAPEFDIEVMFKIRKNTHLARLINAFHAYRRQPAGTYILFYNSQEVNAADTAESLRMLPVDCLRAVTNPALSSFLAGSRRMHPESYYVTVLDTELPRSEYLFRLRRSTSMGRLMEAYCERIDKQPEERNFYFDSKIIVPDDTPHTLGMSRPGFAYLVVSAPPSCDHNLR